jgi:mono/diheme cytochrome c family protein
MGWGAAAIALSGCGASSSYGSPNPAPANPSVLHGISGTVTGQVASGVAVALGGASAASTTTDGAGHYAFTDLADGAYTVTPSLGGYTFNPAVAHVTLSGADVAGQNFTETVVGASTFNVSGAVTGPFKEDVQVTLGGAAALTTTTDSAGHFTFSGVAAGTYTVTPTLTGYAFTPDSAPVTVVDADITLSQSFSEILCVSSLEPTFSDIYTRLLRVSCAGCHASGTRNFASPDAVVALTALRDKTPDNTAAQAAGFKRAKATDSAHSLLVWKLDPNNAGSGTYGSLMPFSAPTGVCAQNLAAIAQWIDQGALAPSEGMTCASDAECDGNLLCIAGTCSYSACGLNPQPTFASIYDNVLKPSCGACHRNDRTRVPGAPPQFVDPVSAANTYALLTTGTAEEAALKYIATSDANLLDSFLYIKVLPVLNADLNTQYGVTTYGAQMPRSPASTGTTDRQNGSICPAAVDAIGQWIASGASNN